MQDILGNYIKSISEKFSHEETSEMGYRTDFENLLKRIFELVNNLRIDHDPKAVKGNKPDFAMFSGEIPLLYVETKDIGVSLDKIEKSNQMDRYYGYANLVLTDYLEFRFYRNGLKYCEPIKIAEYDFKNRTIATTPESYELLIKTLNDFPKSFKEPIKSGKHLSKIMGGKAQRIRDNIRQFYSLESDKNTDLIRLYETIKKLLVHDLTINSFSDMYAQTLVYGLFVARYYDKSMSGFSRQEARELIPNSNPLLRHFFDHIVGADFDNRLKYIVDELCEVFSHANVKELMKEYFKVDLWGKTHRNPDPVIHFYEDFLNEYDPILRKKMGAYYTPLPIVEFIVRSVDYLLKKEFRLTAGLADTSKTKDGLHKVQILDPVCGTGTFISGVIRVIYELLLKSGQKGRWPAYVHHDLLPRLYGFELMMAPYTIAHLKLGIAFRQTGFWDFHRRLGIYLTNSLEESNRQQQNLFTFGLSESIAEESKEASKIKNEKPIMVVIGNPPYSGESSNKNYKGHNVYKVEPTGGKLREKNSKWLNDDYVKFIRFAENMVEKTQEGIVAMITAHGYIDNPTFRGMRRHLMKTFDEIYLLNLHGNANKKEKAPDGGKDKNVFDIKTGVAIFLGIKKKNGKPDQAKVYQADLYGKRLAKFEYLNENQVNTVKWIKVTPVGPYYEWFARDEKVRKEYQKGFSVNELFPVSSIGIVTSRDDFIIDPDKTTLEKRVQEFLHCNSAQEAKSKFKLRESKNWKVVNVLKHEFNENNIFPVDYRPFDKRFIYYHNDFIERTRSEVMKHFLEKDNLGLLIKRQGKLDYSYVFATRDIAESCMFESAYANNTVCPLYLYHDNGEKVSNLNQLIANATEKNVGKVSPEDIFDYIYAVLHSPSYREKYKEFLKIDFPRVPYPKDKKSFRKLVKFGHELRELHLLESSRVNKFITTYPVDGSNIVEKPIYKENKVFINENQFFGKVPELAWNFYIGGYQPAQKWLKDRKGRELTNEDIEHYQKMIVALVETEKTMREIDKFLSAI